MELESGTPPHAPARNGAAPATAPAAPTLPPLRVSGLVVTKADLVRALQVYVPQLVDVAALDGESFVLTLAGTK
ncbi:MAG: hypothetical protein ACRDIY_10595 [Chloroflexota bacterium]